VTARIFSSLAILSPVLPPSLPSHIEWVLKSSRDAAITSHFRPEILILIQKIIKYEKRERNGVSKEYFILSVGRFVAKIWDLKFEKNAFFTKSAAVHNFYIANLPWNLDLNSKSHKIWKNQKGLVFLIFYFVFRLFRCRDMTLQIGGRFWQNHFFTQLGWTRIKRSLFF
jgi:hypothetical protein